MHLGAQAHLRDDLRGAFQRFPSLRLGAIDVSAHWVGSVAENMGNVRMSGILWEPIDAYDDRFPRLQDVLVYGSDYPHYEGGRDPNAVRRKSRALRARDDREVLHSNASSLINHHRHENSPRSFLRGLF